MFRMANVHIALIRALQTILNIPSHNIIQTHNNVCGTDNILWNILHIQLECGKYFGKYCQSQITLL